MIRDAMCTSVPVSRTAAVACVWHEAAAMRTVLLSLIVAASACHPEVDALPDAADPDAADPAPPDADPMLAAHRKACDFGPGDRVEATLGVTAEARAAMPIDHIVIVMQENRSFDHYFGRMKQFGHAEVDGIPAGYTNPKPTSGTAAPTHATTTCISPDIHHGWDAIHAEWNGGMMNGFYKTAAANNAGDGQRALSWYDQRDLPFYYWLYSTFAMSDRFFCATLGPTWPNRDFLYAGTSDGVKNTFERAISVPTVFEELDAAHIAYGVYADKGPRQDCIGWKATHPGFHTTADLYTALANGTLPRVVFVDGEGGAEEHPPADIQGGEAFAHKLFTAAFKSPLWPRMAIFMTYDEAGGFFDHVKPPAACVPSAAAKDALFNRAGVRIPFVIVSPWVKPGYVSHVPLETTSITRFVEMMFDLPALTHRDANADVPLDMFDFSTPHLMTVPTPPAAGTGGCR